MKKNDIYVRTGTDYKKMTRELLEEADLKSMISKGSRIGIKPNLVSPSRADFGATTHPELVAALIEYLQEHHFSDIVMLEGSWVGDKTEDAVRLCGYDEISHAYGVPFLDMQKEKAVKVDCAGLELNIGKAALDIDFMINVPVLKGHCQTKITCALKNMKGLLPNSEKRRFHAMGLHKPIAHLAKVIPQNFILVDNICGDLDFEDGGNPVVMNRIFAGRDPVLIDAYVCHLMHYEISDVPYILMAEELGVGSSDISHANIRTDALDEEKPMPRSRKVVEVSDTVEEVDSCSACYGYLIPALDRLRQEGLLDKLNDKICIGQGYRKKKGKLGIGHCTSEFCFHLEGCPPVENDVYHFLKNYIIGNTPD